MNERNRDGLGRLHRPAFNANLAGHPLSHLPFGGPCLVRPERRYNATSPARVAPESRSLAARRPFSFTRFTEREFAFATNRFESSNSGFWPHLVYSGSFGMAFAVRNAKAKRIKRRSPSLPSVIAAWFGPTKKGRSMTSFFIYFRLWRGFPDSFEFDRFNGLSDEELESELQSYAVQLAQDPEVQARAKERQRKRVEQLKKAQPALTTARVSLPRKTGPTKKLTFPRLDQVDDSTPWREILNRIPQYGRDKIPEWAPGERIWFYETPSREFAEQLVIELDQRRKLDYEKHMAEVELNPRYGLVSTEGLPDGQLASIQRRIKAIQDGKTPPVHNADMAKVLGQKGNEVAQELDEVWRVPVSNEGDQTPTAPDTETDNGGPTTQAQTPGEQATEHADDSLDNGKQAKPVNQQQNTGAPVDQDTDDPEDPDGEQVKQPDNGKDDQPHFYPSLSEAVAKSLVFFKKAKPEKGLTSTQEFILVIAFYKHRYPSLTSADIRNLWIGTYEPHQDAYGLSEKGGGKKAKQANHVTSYITQKFPKLLANLPERR